MVWLMLLNCKTCTMDSWFINNKSSDSWQSIFPTNRIHRTLKLVNFKATYLLKEQFLTNSLQITKLSPSKIALCKLSIFFKLIHQQNNKTWIFLKCIFSLPTKFFCWKWSIMIQSALHKMRPQGAPLSPAFGYWQNLY